MRKIFLILFLGVIVSSAIFAQHGSVRGFVYDEESGEPMIFTNVYLKGTIYGMATDVNGYYNITKIPVGNYSLVVSYLGYDTLMIDIIIRRDKITNKNLNIKKGSIQLEELVISADRQEMRSKVQVSLIKISPKLLEKLPSIGSDPDLAQYLQIIPGVIFTGDQGGQLYIRGGSPIQNKVLLDGMVIYNPFHSIGLFSVFDSDIIRNVDVYTGGFGAKYGGRISSIMDITTKDGNKKRLSGVLSSNTFGSKLLIEGPIIKSTKDNSSSTSLIFSAKTSYLNKTSKFIYPYIAEGGLPYSFNDLYGKVSINSKSGSKVNLFGFNFSDRVNYQLVSDLNWESRGIGGNVILVPGASSVLIKTSFSFSEYGINFKEEGKAPSLSTINGYRFGLDFVYFLGNSEFDYGIETTGNATEYEFYNSIGRKIGRNQPVSNTELAGYVNYKYSNGKLLIEPSFRMQYYASLSYFSPEPRLGVKYNYNDKLRFKFAGGFYSQNLVSAISERDVVNLFYGFLSGNYNLQDEFNGVEITKDLQTSRHAILGFDYDITNNLLLQVEGYIKHNPQLIVVNRNKIYDDNAGNYDKDDYFKKDFIIEKGSAYGVDFLLKYDYKRTFLWFVYSLGKITRNDGVYDYSPHFDRRHNINLVASQVFGRDLNWEVSARWNLGSGFPTRQTQGYYEIIPFMDGIGTDYTTANGQLGILYTGIEDKTRLPYYHRFDFTIKKTYYFGNYSELKAMFSVTNVYNRENIFYQDRVTNERVNQLPIMPSFGLSLKF